MRSSSVFVSYLSYSLNKQCSSISFDSFCSFTLSFQCVLHLFRGFTCNYSDLTSQHPDYYEEWIVPLHLKGLQVFLLVSSLLSIYVVFKSRSIMRNQFLWNTRTIINPIDKVKICGFEIQHHLYFSGRIIVFVEEWNFEWSCLVVDILDLYWYKLTDLALIPLVRLRFHTNDLSGIVLLLI